MLLSITFHQVHLIMHWKFGEPTSMYTESKSTKSVNNLQRFHNTPWHTLSVGGLGEAGEKERKPPHALLS